MAGIPDLVRLVADLATYEAAVAAGKTSPDVMYLILAEKQVYFQGELWSKASEEGGGVEEAVAAINATIVENEEIIAAAFNDVNERINAISENVGGTTVTKEELESTVETINQTISDNKSATDTAIEGLETSIGNVDAKFANYATTEALTTEITNLTNEIIANEEVHATALNDLNTRLAALEVAIANL